MGLAVNGLLDGETLGFRDTVGFCEIVGEAVTGGAVRSMDMPLPLPPELLFFMRIIGLLLLFRQTIVQIGDSSILKSSITNIFNLITLLLNVKWDRLSNPLSMLPQ